MGSGGGEGRGDFSGCLSIGLSKVPSPQLTFSTKLCGPRLQWTARRPHSECTLALLHWCTTLGPPSAPLRFWVEPGHSTCLGFVSFHLGPFGALSAWTLGVPFNLLPGCGLGNPGLTATPRLASPTPQHAAKPYNFSHLLPRHHPTVAYSTLKVTEKLRPRPFSL